MPRAILAAGSGFAVSLLAACGGGGNGLLSGDQSNSLQSHLNQISSAVAARNCLQADRGSQALAVAVEKLPSTVNVTLHRDLAQGAHTVADLAMQDCHRQTTTTTATTTTTTPTTTTATTPTTTATTQTTTPTTPTTTPTTPTTTTPTTPTTPTTTPTTPTTPTNPSGGGGLGGGGKFHPGGKGK